MANICDYLRWRGDLSLKKFCFNEVDNLILSEFSYLNLDNILNRKMTIKEAIDLYLEKYSENEILNQFSLSKNPLEFYNLLKESSRFGNLKVFKYVNDIAKENDKQFSALIVELNHSTIYVSFKGTDHTLIGWKEDFNLSYMDKIPSQIDAVNYLNNNINLKYRHIYLGGHSKGGNLAVYAAINCKKGIKKRIKAVFNNDGPGFLDEFVNSSEYTKMLSKIVTILPETSIIGMLLTHKGEYKVVKSNAHGIWQHDALSWQVERDHFITIEEVDEISNRVRLTITDWLQNVSKEKREVFINSLFSILEKNNIETVEDLTRLKLRKVPGLLIEFNKMDEEAKKMTMELLKELIREANKNFDHKFIFSGLKTINKR